MHMVIIYILQLKSETIPFSTGITLVDAGFEPAHPEIVGLKSTALDHSANLPQLIYTSCLYILIDCRIFIDLHIELVGHVDAHHDVVVVLLHRVDSRNSMNLRNVLPNVLSYHQSIILLYRQY